MSARRGRGLGRSAARLGAVQALYQIELGGASAEHTVAEFEDHRLGAEIEGIAYADADLALFGAVVRGASARAAEIDALIVGTLSRDWALGRLDCTVRAILRAATFELLARPAVPARVVINEYVDVAHAFFGGTEPGFVNGVLDTLVRTIRPGELGANSDERAAETH